MGCINTSESVNVSAEERSFTILTAADNNSPKQEIKTFKTRILGCDQSGKSTTFQSIKWMNIETTEHELEEEIKPVIRQRCVGAILLLLKQSQILFEENNIIYNQCYVDLNDE
eukprot:33474_1